MTNWATLGQATGWLPGAGIGALAGGLLAALTWEDTATDTCQLGTSSVTQACANIAGIEFTNGATYMAAAAALSGLVGAGVNSVVARGDQNAA